MMGKAKGRRRSASKSACTSGMSLSEESEGGRAKKVKTLQNEVAKLVNTVPSSLDKTTFKAAYPFIELFDLRDYNGSLDLFNCGLVPIEALNAALQLSILPKLHSSSRCYGSPMRATRPLVANMLTFIPELLRKPKEAPESNKDSTSSTATETALDDDDNIYLSESTPVESVIQTEDEQASGEEGGWQTSTESGVNGAGSVNMLQTAHGKKVPFKGQTPPDFIIFAERQDPITEELKTVYRAVIDAKAAYKELEWENKYKLQMAAYLADLAEQNLQDGVQQPIVGYATNIRACFAMVMKPERLIRIDDKGAILGDAQTKKAAKLKMEQWRAAVAACTGSGDIKANFRLPQGEYPMGKVYAVRRGETAFGVDFPLVKGAGFMLGIGAYKMVQALLLAGSESRAKKLTAAKVDALVKQLAEENLAAAEHMKPIPSNWSKTN